MNIDQLHIKDVILVRYPLEEDPKKYLKRPAIVIDKDIQNLQVLVVKVTKTLPRDVYDYRLIDWLKANLAMESTARGSKLQIIRTEDVLFKIGELTEHDFKAVMHKVMLYMKS